MRFLVDILHPAHVHFFRFIISTLESKGHQVLLVAREKDVTLNLLDEFGLEYYKTSKPGNKHLSLYQEFIKRSFQIKKIIKDFKPDVLTGISGPNISILGRVLRTRSVIFTDTEDAKLQGNIGQYFSNFICTPRSFAKDLGSKQFRYKGFQELAYLHPNYFHPNPEVLEKEDLSKNEKFFVLRFVAWKASHDFRQSGLSFKDKKKIISILQELGKVIIVSEKKIPKRFQKFKLKGKSSDLHHLLHYATMLIGDSQTMTTEAGLLGTPGIRCNSLVGSNHGVGNMNKLEHDYKLIYSFKDSKKMIGRVLELLKDDDLKRTWEKRRKLMLNNTEDITAYSSRFLEKIASL